MWVSLFLLSALATHNSSSSTGDLAPRLTTSKNSVHLSWVAKGKHESRLMTATFDGSTWSDTERVTSSSTLFVNWADVPGVVQAGSGLRLAHWLQKRSGGKYAYDIHLALDDGQGWKRLGPLHLDNTPTEHGFVSVVALKDGFRLVWLDGRQTASKGPMTLRHATVSREGRVHDLGVLDDRVCDCCGTAAVSDGSGGARVWYRNRTEAEVRDIHTVVSTTGGSSASRVAYGDNWTVRGCPVNGPALSRSTDQTVGAWFTAASGTGVVKAGFLDVNGQVAQPTTVFSPSSGRVDVVSVGDEGIVSALAEDGTILLRRFNKKGGLGAPHVVAKASATRSSGFPQLARLNDILVVVWTDTAKDRPSRIQRRTMPLSSVPPIKAPVSSSEPQSALRAPSFDLPTLSGLPARMPTSRPTVLHLWASWCRPCLEEMPSFIRTARRLRANGVDVWLVSVDETEVGRRRARTLAQSWGAFDLVVIDDGSVANQLRAPALPATFGFSTSGALRFTQSGQTSAATLLDVMRPSAPALSPRAPNEQKETP